MIDRAARGEERLTLFALMFDQAGNRRRRHRDGEYLRAVCRQQRDAADAMFFEEIDEAELQAVARVALQKVEAETRQLARRRRAFDRDLRDRRRVQPPGDFVLDDRPGAHANLVDDQLVGQDPKRHLLTAVQRHQRSLTCVDRVEAHLAGRGVGVELLDRSPEQLQEVLDR